MGNEDSDINMFRLVGNVGLVRPAATPGGRQIVNFTVATHYPVWDSLRKQRREETEWHDLVAFDEVAARLKQEIDKGVRVEVTGYLRTRQWEDKNNNLKHWRRELIVQEFKVLPRHRAKVEPMPAEASIPEQDADSGAHQPGADEVRVRVF
jgi:single-strand DNA-binding protein